MALDVYVMPLIRFKRGEFTTAVERLAGGKAKIIGLDGKSYEKGMSERKARNEIEKMNDAVRLANPGAVVEWSDEGEVLFAEQGSYTAMKAYARWVDLQDEFPSFDSPPENDWYKHSAYELKGDREWTFPAIVEHSLHAGYLLPCSFDKQVLVEEWEIGKRRFYKSVGAVHRVRDELTGLAELVGDLDVNKKTWDHLDQVRWEVRQLSEATRLAFEYGLPVIFFG